MPWAAATQPTMAAARATAPCMRALTPTPVRARSHTHPASQRCARRSWHRTTPCLRPPCIARGGGVRAPGHVLRVLHATIYGAVHITCARAHSSSARTVMASSAGDVVGVAARAHLLRPRRTVAAGPAAGARRPSRLGRAGHAHSCLFQQLNQICLQVFLYCQLQRDSTFLVFENHRRVKFSNQNVRYRNMHLFDSNV